jgi:hypothetical protein
MATSALFIWHLLMVPLALVGTLVAALWLLARLVVGSYHPKITSGDGVTRRAFFVRLCALTPPALTVALSLVSEQQLRHFRTRRLTVTLPTLPAALDGMTIAHVADIHAGRFTNGSILSEIADATNALHADMVLFAGDLINDSLGYLDDGIATMKRISGPLALCEGNHDLIEDPDEFRSRVRASGLTLLVDEATTFHIRGVPVQILGMQWGTDSKRSMRNGESELVESAERLGKLRNPAAFQILLAHHPHSWDYMRGVPLAICGHTHGGQLMVTEKLGFGPVLFRYWSGLYTRRAASHADGEESLVVSNGIGNWFPLRTRAPAEIIHITLKRPVA